MLYNKNNRLFYDTIFELLIYLNELKRKYLK